MQIENKKKKTHDSLHGTSSIAIKIIASDTSQWLSTATEVIRELAAGAGCWRKIENGRRRAEE